MSSQNPGSATHYRWDDIPLEAMKGTITRRWVTTDRIMVAQVFFKAGDDVPRHAHVNEQFTYILSGALRFWIGNDAAQEIVVRAGELIVIPSYVPHRAVALEDTLDIDVFNPPREDWLAKTDAYLRG